MAVTSTASSYWEERARRFAIEGEGLAAVRSYGMPAFYNRVIDLCQRLALAPWLRVRPGTRVLDVGCGVGRWCRELRCSWRAGDGSRLQSHHDCRGSATRHGAWCVGAMQWPHLPQLAAPVRTAALALATALSVPIDVLLGRSAVKRSWHAVFILEQERDGL
jgi:SAM-dependent methyltransferase